MSNETRKRIVHLLETYRERARRIALLHYELEHPAKVSPEEMMEAMAFGHGNDMPGSNRHISDKTLYIALNYQERMDKINSESTSDIVERLVELEHEQQRLVYCVSLLGHPYEEAIRMFYFEGRSWENIAKEIQVALRTIYKIKNKALDCLAEMYEFSEEFQ